MSKPAATPTSTATSTPTATGPRRKVRYLVRRAGGRGEPPRFFWQPSTDLQRQHGWPAPRLAVEAIEAIMRPALDAGRADAIAAAEALAWRAAADEAETWNAKLDQWRAELAEAEAPGPRAGAVDALVAHYRRHRVFKDLKPKTRREYERYLRIIEQWGRNIPVAQIGGEDADALYEAHADRAPAVAHHLIRVARLLWEHALRFPKSFGASHNPFAKMRIGLVRQTPPRLWKAEDVACFVATADAMGHFSVGTAVMLNWWIGQRQDDVLSLPRAAYRDGALWIAQAKTGQRLVLDVDIVPEVLTRIEQELERQRARARAAKVTPLPAAAGDEPTLLVCESTGRKWGGDHFRHTFAAVRAAAAKTRPQLTDIRFMWLRHTAITALFDAGVAIEDIAAVSGHSMRTVIDITETYRERTRHQAKRALTARVNASREGQQE